MGWLGKIVGGTFGFVFGGPLGMIAGAAFVRNRFR
jgi:DnaJ like chaperone protein